MPLSEGNLTPSFSWASIMSDGSRPSRSETLQAEGRHPTRHEVDVASADVLRQESPAFGETQLATYPLLGQRD